MKTSFAVIAILLFAMGVMGCVSSQPIDVELAVQNDTNISTTNSGTIELVNLLDTAKQETPDAAWVAAWDEGAKASHLLQIEANKKIAAKVLERAKEVNPEE